MLRRSKKPAPPQTGPPKRPLSPKLVTAAALFLPGSGQVLNGDAIRGITMQFFMMFMAYITYMVTGPDISFIGRIAGGVFVYLVSVLDARTVAIKRMRAYERMTAPDQGADAGPGSGESAAADGPPGPSA